MAGRREILDLLDVENIGITRAQADEVLDDLLHAIRVLVFDGQTVQLRGFGSFRLQTYDSREFTNAYGTYKVPPQQRLAFRALGSSRRRGKRTRIGEGSGAKNLR